MRNIKIRKKLSARWCCFHWPYLWVFGCFSCGECFNLGPDSSEFLRGDENHEKLGLFCKKKKMCLVWGVQGCKFKSKILTWYESWQWFKKLILFSFIRALTSVFFILINKSTKIFPPSLWPWMNKPCFVAVPLGPLCKHPLFAYEIRKNKGYLYQHLVQQTTIINKFVMLNQIVQKCTLEQEWSASFRVFLWKDTSATSLMASFSSAALVISTESQKACKMGQRLSGASVESCPAQGVPSLDLSSTT